MSSGNARSSFEATPLDSNPPDPVDIHARRLSIGATGRGRTGNYRLIAPVARGGMGEVYLAETMLTNGERRQVIIKRLLEGLQDDTAHVQMFRSEAEHLALLDHKNIVQILDVPEINGARCLALEYVRGRSVAQILDRTRHVARRVPPEIAVFVISEVLEGLDHVHNARLADGQPVELVHRDVTPGNLLVSFDGDVKITDFGISKSVMSKVATTVGIVKGKARYLAPEQILGERASAQSDIFSTMCVMFEMLTSIPLFDRPSVPKTLTAIVHGEIPELRSVLPFPSAARLLDLIGQALSVRVDKRPARARDLARDLRDAANRELGPLMSKAAVAAFMRQLFEGQDEVWELAIVPVEPHEPGAGTPSSPAMQMDRDPLVQEIADRRPIAPLRAGSIADDDAVSGDAPPPTSPVSEPPPFRGTAESTMLVERARARAAPTEVVVRVTHGVVPSEPREASVTPSFDGEEATQAIIPHSPIVGRVGEDAATVAEIALRPSSVNIRSPDESDDSTLAHDEDDEEPAKFSQHDPTQVEVVRRSGGASAQSNNDRMNRLIGTVPVKARPAAVGARTIHASSGARRKRAWWSRRPLVALLGVFVLGASTGIAITALFREKPVPAMAPLAEDEFPPPDDEIVEAKVADPAATPAPVAPAGTGDPAASPEASLAAAPNAEGTPSTPSAPTIDLLYPHDARVRIDGKWLPGKIPLRGVELEPGTRTITVVWRGKKRDMTLEANPGDHAVLGSKEFKRGTW